MSRPLRLEFDGALYHVTARGNARAAIFADDEDRGRFLAVLAQRIGDRDWRLHGFCLMGNHYHLLIETPHAGLTQGMRDLNGIYAQAFNRRHRRVGHLLQGRYHAVLVERDSHLLELARYVVRNPVRAGLVASPADWPWSSYRATAGLCRASPWLTIDWLLGQFAPQRRVARAAYRAFVADGGPPVWDGLTGQVWLGTPEWIARTKELIAAPELLHEVPRVQRFAPPSLAAIAAAHTDRAAAMRTAHATGCWSLRAIGRHFGVHESTVSRAVRR